MLIILFYNILVRMMVGHGSDAALGIAILLMFAVAAHVLVNIILMIVYFVRGENEIGRTYLLNLFLVAIIGFGACWGNAFSVAPGSFI